jgi:hypothetical protein
MRTAALWPSVCVREFESENDIIDIIVDAHIARCVYIVGAARGRCAR